MAEIACNVQNCHYWDQGNKCTAKKIQISNVNYSTDMEVGSFEEPALAGNSYETQCVAFKAKE